MWDWGHWSLLFSYKPSTNHHVPITKYQSARTKYQAPITRYQSPSTNHQVPITRYQSPGTKYKIPGTKYQIPGTEYQVPITRYQSSGTNHQVPTTRYQSPCTNQQVPSHPVPSAKYSARKYKVEGCLNGETTFVPKIAPQMRSPFPHAKTSDLITCSNDKNVNVNV